METELTATESVKFITFILGKEFEVKKVGNRYYYWSYKAGRWLPVAKANVIIAESLVFSEGTEI